ncbi:MAG: YlxR family protein [Actinobacteria bacterium]|nr:YlxR family protein [Actinomycetota bacterium]
MNRNRRTRKDLAEPQRTCVGCRRVAGQSELVRLTRRPDGGLAVGRQEPGRGAWLCRGDASCLEAALRRRALTRSLRGEVSEAAAEALRARLS